MDVSAGLSSDEVKKRRERFGLNQITPKKGTPLWLRFLMQFNQPLVYILLVATAITLFLKEWVDASVIFGVVFINAISWLSTGIQGFESPRGAFALDDLFRLRL